MARAAHGMSPLPIQIFKGPEVQAKIHDAMARARLMPSHSYPVLNVKKQKFLLVCYCGTTGKYTFFDKYGFEVTHMVEACRPKAPADEVSYFDWTSPKGSVYQTKLEAVANGEQCLTKTNHIREF